MCYVLALCQSTSSSSEALCSSMCVRKHSVLVGHHHHLPSQPSSEALTKAEHANVRERETEPCESRPCDLSPASALTRAMFSTFLSPGTGPGRPLIRIDRQNVSVLSGRSAESASESRAALHLAVQSSSSNLSAPNSAGASSRSLSRTQVGDRQLTYGFL